jgi:hypothetical protein
MSQGVRRARHDDTTKYRTSWRVECQTVQHVEEQTRYEEQRE